MCDSSVLNSRPDLQTVATVQELETEHQAVADEPVRAPGSAPVFDSAERREQLLTRLAAGVPDSAIDARTLADVAQAHDPAEAPAQTAEPSARPRPQPTRASRRDRRQPLAAR